MTIKFKVSDRIIDVIVYGITYMMHHEVHAVHVVCVLDVRVMYYFYVLSIKMSNPWTNPVSPIKLLFSYGSNEELM